MVVCALVSPYRDERDEVRSLAVDDAFAPYLDRFGPLVGA